MTYRGPPLPPPTVLTALALGDPPDDITRVIPPADSPFNARDYTLDLFDDGLFKRSTNANSVNVNVLANVDMPIPVNSHVHFTQGGAGEITFVAAPGVTFYSAGATATAGQWQVLHLWQFALNQWLFYGHGTGGGGGGGDPAPPDKSVQFNNAGVFGGSANWTFDPPNSRFTLGTDVQQQRESAFTLSFHTTTTAALTTRFYGYRNPADPTSYDRLTMDYSLDPEGGFYSGIKLESDDGRDNNGWVLLQPTGYGGLASFARETGDDGRGDWTVDLQPSAFFNDRETAGGNSSAIVGGFGNAIAQGATLGAAGTRYSGIFAGRFSFITPNHSTVGEAYAANSVIIGGDNGFISGSYSVSAAGQFCSIVGNRCASIGGYTNYIGQPNYFNRTPIRYEGSVLLGGSNNYIYGNYAVALGGQFNWVDAIGAVAMGNFGHTRGVPNCFVQGAGKAQWGGTNPQWPGQMQTVSYVLQVRTITSVQTVMTTDGLAPVAANSLVVRHNSAYMFEARIVAKHLGFPAGAAFIVTGLVCREIAASNIFILGTPTVTVVARTNAAWNVAVGVNTTLGSLEFKVTGTDPTGISGELWWCAQVRTAEAYTDETVPS